MRIVLQILAFAGEAVKNVESFVRIAENIVRNVMNFFAMIADCAENVPVRINGVNTVTDVQTVRKSVQIAD